MVQFTVLLMIVIALTVFLLLLQPTTSSREWWWSLPRSWPKRCETSSSGSLPSWTASLPPPRGGKHAQQPPQVGSEKIIEVNLDILVQDLGFWNQKTEDVWDRRWGERVKSISTEVRARFRDDGLSGFLCLVWKPLCHLLGSICRDREVWLLAG